MKTRVYDVPTRLFHGLFALSFIGAFAIANTVDDESAVFAWHMLAGLLMVFVVLWRLVWGLLGSTHARFSDFQLNPLALARYLGSVVGGSSRKWAGHNPASSWAAVVMMALALGLGVTGYLMATGGGETWEDVHELLANAFFAVMLLHVAGVVVHQLKHRDLLAHSMLTGDKQDVDQSSAAVPSHTLVGMALLAATLWFGSYLLQNFDQNRGTLQLFGTTLSLGEAEEDGDAEEAGEAGEGAKAGSGDEAEAATDAAPSSTKAATGRKSED